MMKRIILVIAAVAALTAFAAPAASANNLLNEGNWFEDAKVETFTGNFGFENEMGGWACEDATIETSQVSNSMETVSMDLDACGTTGLLAAFGCEPSGTYAEALPWPVAIGDGASNVFKVSDVYIRLPMEPGCFLGDELVIDGSDGGDMIMTPNNPYNIGYVTLSGYVESSIGPVEIQGELDAANPGRFEFEN